MTEDLGLKIQFEDGKDKMSCEALVRAAAYKPMDLAVSKIGGGSPVHIPACQVA
jgi:hypothetical protein